MRALRIRHFNPGLPLQTADGTCEALQSGMTKINELAAAGELDLVYIDRSRRFTTESIFALIERRRRKAKETAA
jgi:hypothetical protein